MTGNAPLLGDFIRRHREKVTPQQAGLSIQGRRRTQGLRREELALLCGISNTWVTWIEQGRPVQPSTAVLDRLSQTLQLSVAERAYLFDLAGRADPVADKTHAQPPRAVLRIVQALDTPAYVLDRYWNAIAWNTAAAAHFVGWMDQPQTPSSPPPNLLEFLLLNPTARAFVADWEGRTRRIIAEFRADVGKHLDDPQMARQIEHLQQNSPIFAQLWAAQDVVEREGGRRVFQHPQHGQVVYEQSTLLPATSTDLKLVILLPLGIASPQNSG